MNNVYYRFLLEVNKENNKDRFKLKPSPILYLRASFFYHYLVFLYAKTAHSFQWKSEVGKTF